MTATEALVLELVQAGETPLYSVYCWVGRQLGRDVDLRELLRVIGSAIERDELRLWRIHPESGDRTELFALPEDLADKYLAETSLDDEFDPFCLSLTIGQAGPTQTEPAWTLDLDFEEGVFRLESRYGDEAAALQELVRLYPELEVSVQVRQSDGDRVRIVGTFREVRT